MRARAPRDLATPPDGGVTVAPSLVFGYFRDRYDSIVPGTALHVFYNCGWFLILGT